MRVFFRRGFRLWTLLGMTYHSKASTAWKEMLQADPGDPGVVPKLMPRAMGHGVG